MRLSLRKCGQQVSTLPSELLISHICKISREPTKEKASMLPQIRICALPVSTVRTQWPKEIQWGAVVSAAATRVSPLENVSLAGEINPAAAETATFRVHAYAIGFK
jgi:hypothetical protein